MKPKTKYTVLIKRIDNNKLLTSEQVTGLDSVYSAQDRLLGAINDNIYYADYVEGWK